MLSTDCGEAVAKKLLPKIHGLLLLTDSEDHSLVGTLCWLLSNYVMCGERYVDSILKNNLHLRICALFGHKSEKVKLEALWIICNMASAATDAQLAILLSNQVISILIAGLENSDAAIHDKLINVHLRLVERPEYEAHRGLLADELEMLEIDDERVESILAFLNCNE